MISLHDYIAVRGLKEEEVMAIAEHESRHSLAAQPETEETIS
jgi:hypothetical protein